jgi:antitoxin component of MazEF toxin-antitoxin module
VPSFDAEVRASGRGSHAVVVPKSVLGDLGSRRVLVRIGSESFEATLGAYGGRTFLGLRKAVLTAVGVTAGDSVHVELEPLAPVADPEPEPAATTCPELDAATETDTAWRDAWLGLPAGHREEYGRWISAGADPDDRRARVARLRHRLLPT